MEYIIHLLILIGIYVMLSQTLCFSAGLGGLISMAHAGFYGIGAYTAAILATNFQTPFLLILPIAMLICGLLALLVASIALRTVDDYFIICTLGIQVIVYSIMNNWSELTNGPLGIVGVPPIEIFGIGVDSKLTYLLITIFFACLIFTILNYISHTAFGRTLKSLSEDEIFTASLGKNVYLTKLMAFTLSGLLAAIPGVLYAYYISYIDPTSFTVDESIFILSIVIIGGMQDLKGCIYAVVFLILLPETLRFIGLPNSIAANIRQIIYGIIMICVIFRHVYKTNRI